MQEEPTALFQIPTAILEWKKISRFWDENLNEAFTHAYLNLEYAWLYPLGWIESIQHWPTMWHMEQTAAEEWC